MAYINEGDALIVNGENAIALCAEYAELYYDAEAREMMRYGLDYGVARVVVRVLFPKTGVQTKEWLGVVRRVNNT